MTNSGQQSQMEFHNPYHFVPVKGDSERQADLSREDFIAGKVGQVTHDRYLSARDGQPVYSGRILCKLTTKDPVVVGNQRDDLPDGSHRVLPFELEPDKPAVSGATLRGLISTIAETASNSSLRVLINKFYAHRMAPEINNRTNDFFNKISRETLPFNHRRRQITSAEQLFGFVEQNQPGSNLPLDYQSLALAGRVYFSAGTINPSQTGPYYQESALLKILDAPKPPFPGFYFKRQGTPAYIDKTSLNSRGPHLPQGRKFYLHRLREDPNPWVTRRSEDQQRLQQKSRVTPIKPGVVFYFHVDFENLSRRELGLLCYALQPASNYRHKLGMGKPIGLGKVRIDPIGLLCIDRLRRYRRDTIILGPERASRYHTAWFDPDNPPGTWPDCYTTERREAQTGRLDNSPDPLTLRDEFGKSMDPDIRQALELLGDPSKITRRVHYPQVSNVPEDELELETYRWFVANSKPEGHQYLKPLNRNTNRLEVFRRLQS